MGAPTMMAVFAKGRAALSRIGEPMAELRRFAPYVLRRFGHDDVMSMASALSYTSLLAMVPLLAIALAMLTAFPVFDPVRDQLQALVFQYFVPAVGEAVRSQISGFVENTGKLTAVGIVGLAVTAVMLLVTIESSFNLIFRVRTSRSAVSRLLVYWTALTLGPLLIGASFSLSGYLAAARRWAEGEGLSGVTVALAGVMPTVLMGMAFGLLYLAVPNRPVRIAHAALGGVTAALIFAGLRAAFAIYVGSARAYESVYGALSAVPLFLIWMWLSWLAVLMGAEVTAALPEWITGRHDHATPLPARRRVNLALEVLSVLHQAAQRGLGGTQRRDLLDHTAAAEAALLGVLDRLCAAGWVTRIEDGRRYLLSRDLAAVTLHDLARALDLGMDHEEAGPQTGWRQKAAIRLAQAADLEREALSTSIRDLLDEFGPLETGRERKRA
ncbi:MAG: YihY family inner membrane protein [Alphaproteobacteria bacterium]|nr:YihY family inner membrane protein [Alphaproteobacteria bacterium]